MSPFAQSEIDSLVGEVGDVSETETPATTAAAAPVEEGAWIGVREEDEAPSFADESSAYGSSVPLEDLLAAREEPVADSLPVAVPASPPPPERRAETPSSEFEVDRGFDPEWSRPEPMPSPIAMALRPAEVHDDAPIVPFPIPEAGATEDEAGQDDVRLTEVASDEDLFSDPSLEIAHLVVGQTREIMVPVMLGEGATAGRFKLAIRLRLEPVE
jgi:hypothetical protein